MLVQIFTYKPVKGGLILNNPSNNNEQQPENFHHDDQHTDNNSDNKEQQDSLQNKVEEPYDSIESERDYQPSSNEDQLEDSNDDEQVEVELTNVEHSEKEKTTKTFDGNKSAFFVLRFFNNLPIGYKYLVIFSFSVILFFGATVIVYLQLSSAKDDVQSIIEQNEIASAMTEMALIVEQQDSAIAAYALVGNARYIEEYENMEVQIEEIFAKLDKVFVDGDEELTYGAIKMNSENITNLFLNRLVTQRQNDEDIIGTQLEIDTQKNVLINLISSLIRVFSDEQGDAVENVNASMNKSIAFLVVINVVSIILGFIVLVIISRYISNNLKRVVTATTTIADGDLTLKPLTYNGKDEIGLLSNAVNSLNSNIKGIIGKVNEASDKVTSSSELLMLSSREVKKGSEQMVITMDELASGAETQADSASHLSEKMGQFVESVQASQKDGEAVVQSSEQVISLTSEGAQLMNQSVNQMNKIDQIVSDSVEKVKGLDEKSEQISHLVDVVKGIADQTNLLALNAAIEAARAGEHGRGFAVVAEEVRKLAEEVAVSVTEITGIVSMIQAETDEVVTTLNGGYQEVKSGTEQIEETGKSFNTIEHFVSGMVDNINEVANRLGQIATDSEEMNNLIADIAAVSEEAAAGVEQSSAATQQTSSSMDEISVNAEELSNLAEQLSREINVFKI